MGIDSYSLDQYGLTVDMLEPVFAYYESVSALLDPDQYWSRPSVVGTNILN